MGARFMRLLLAESRAIDLAARTRPHGCAGAMVTIQVGGGCAARARTPERTCAKGRWFHMTRSVTDDCSSNWTDPCTDSRVGRATAREQTLKTTAPNDHTLAACKGAAGDFLPLGLMYSSADNTYPQHVTHPCCGISIVSAGINLWCSGWSNRANDGRFVRDDLICDLTPMHIDFPWEIEGKPHAIALD